MLLACRLVDLTPPRQYLSTLAVMALIRGHVADLPMVVLVVVPAHETVAPLPGLLKPDQPCAGRQLCGSSSPMSLCFVFGSRVSTSFR